MLPVRSVKSELKFIKNCSAGFVNRHILNIAIKCSGVVICNQSNRGVQTSSVQAGVNKGQLSKLRKKTGFPFVNCKKALEKFDNDINKAEEWLKEQAQKEGWSKASKLQNRPMSQGLIGLVVDNNSAAMIEVNCETDFVARNTKFQNLVCQATQVFLQHGRQAGLRKMLLNQDDLSNVKIDGGKSLSDLVAMEIGNVGENMLLRRAAYLQVTGELKLGSYIHSTGGPNLPKEGSSRLGKYGALLMLTQTPEDGRDQLSCDDLGHLVGQHIVGMNPQCVGDPEGSPLEHEQEESRLIFQEFLADPDMTVHDFLQANGGDVQDFVRFECGEELSTDTDRKST